MKVLVLFSLIFHVYAKDLRASKFWVQIGKTKIHLSLFNGGFIEESCKKKCVAYTLLNQKVKDDVKIDEVSKNPKSEKCKKLGGVVIIGKLYSGHSQSFCQAKDKSIVSTNIL